MGSHMATKAPTKKAPVAKKAAPKKASSEGFAVIATGGKQYLVAVGDTVTIEKLPGEFKKGDSVTFDQVLLTASAIGTPMVAGGSVAGEVVSVGRSPKVMVIRYKQKSRYQKKNGHRQPFLKVKITSIK